MVLRFNKDALSFALKPKEKSEASPKKSKAEALKDQLQLDAFIKGNWSVIKKNSDIIYPLQIRRKNATRLQSPTLEWVWTF